MPTVLVVDDEANIRDLVSLYLTAAGLTVLTAPDGPSALAVVRDGRADLVVLDYLLPGMDGAHVCAAIRAESSLPVIMLTARDSDLDKVALLEAGADDYIVKPFSPPELVARVRAVLRRAGGGASFGEVRATALDVGGLKLDPATREVSVDGAEVALTAREFDLLAVLAGHPGVVFSRDQLLDSSGTDAHYADARGIDVHVRHLREKLGDDASEPRFIETVRGVGYRLRRTPL